jgi:hypothetical protein
VDDEIDRRPARRQRFERGVERGHVRYVAIDEEIGTDLFGQRLHALEQRIALIGKGQFGPLRVQCLGDPPCQRLVVGQAHDEPALALHQSGHFV